MERRTYLKPRNNSELPPHSEKEEQALLGCFLLDGSCVEKAAAKFAGANPFYDPRHAALWTCLVQMQAEARPIDIVTVRATFALLDNGPDSDVFLSALPDATPSAANWEYYAAELLELHHRRKALAAIAEFKTLVNDRGVKLGTALAGLRNFVEIVAPGPVARLLNELAGPSGGDADELIEHRFLCRTAGALLCGPTGIGKSSLAMQFMVTWALGQECFGIRPKRRLKSLLVQAENDDGDLAEMRNGVIAGLGLSAKDAEEACRNIVVAREDSRTGLDFVQRVLRPLLEKYRPDVVWIDPALAYLGADAASQRDVSAFLRNWLNPLLREFNCAAVIVHHTNKPLAGREKPNWSGGDFAYLGSGSIEWANWARAILALRSLGSHEVFELRAAKRGSRLGWQDAAGATSYAKLIEHAREPGVICWRPASEDSVPSLGRPKNISSGEVLELLPAEGMLAKDWQEAALRECGVKEATFHRCRQELAKAGRVIKSKMLGKWQPLLKGTHA